MSALAAASRPPHVPGMSKRSAGGIAVVPTPWQDILLLCKKCGRKLDGGFGADGEDSLRGALREALRERGQRRTVRVLEVGCFGVCPKGAVVVGRGGRPGELLVVPGGTEADALLDRMLPVAAA